MYKIISVTILFVGLAACVPAKKYNELLENSNQCNEELAKYKTDALNFGAKVKEYEAQLALMNQSVTQLVKDTSDLGHKYRTTLAKYEKALSDSKALEEVYEKLRISGAKDAATLQSQLEAKKLELQLKEDALIKLEKELREKEMALIEREKRVTELEEIIKSKDAAVKALKEKVAKALKGFENRGLSVVEKNGKIYVSLEAKLLFASGSTVIEPDGKLALVELAKVLENEKELEIIVEGHTDTDKMKSSAHPANNWELSVLRSTAVIEIMTLNSGIDPKQLMAAGRSEFHPVSEEDKAKNRRIEIIISPNLNELYELISE